MGPEHEEPVFFRSNGDMLFGIHTRPAARAIGRCVIVLAGAGQPKTPRRHSPHVSICQGLAEDGYHALRFDYHGVGESTGSVDRFALDEPFAEDLEAAARWVISHELGTIVPVGFCFGARSVLAAVERLPDLHAVVLMSVPPSDFDWRAVDRAGRAEARVLVRRALSFRSIRDVLDPAKRRAYARFAGSLARRLGRRLRRNSASTHRPEAGAFGWVSPAFSRGLEQLIDRHIPILLVYGEDDPYLDDFRLAASGPLRDLMSRADDLVEITTIPGHLHSFPGTSVCEHVLRIVRTWLTRIDEQVAAPS
jgi:pimeloyl-ACP methyl ester carboxylesterase